MEYIYPILQGFRQQILVMPLHGGIELARGLNQNKGLWSHGNRNCRCKTYVHTLSNLDLLFYESQRTYNISFVPSLSTPS